jgi:formate hydrogenlyase subunit 3/multisubunit Na+/H+ antiporter MnhD subunit
MVEEFVFGAVWLLIAAGGLAVLIQGSGAGSTLAALRFLSLTAIALPLLLSVVWMDESDQFRFLDSITLLNAVALLLLTATFPFQIWIAPVVRESSSLTPSIVYGVGQLLVVVFSLNLLIDQPFVYGSAQFQTILRLSAGATLILGAVLTVTARSFGQQLGYLLLISIGAVVAVIGSGAVTSVEVTLSLLFLRVIGLVLAGAGLTMIRKRARVVEGEANQFTANKGLAWTTPFGMGLFVFGCLSLAGMPLTPGFAGVWPAVLAVGKLSPWLAVVLVFSIAGGAFGVLRRLIPLLSRSDESAGERAVPSETRKEQIASGAILVVGAIVALFPGLVLTFTSELAGLF